MMAQRIIKKIWQATRKATKKNKTEVVLFVTIPTKSGMKAGDWVEITKLDNRGGHLANDPTKAI